MEFIDDYRLLVSLDSTADTPPSLVVMDMEKGAEGVPMQTFFHLSPWFINSETLSHSLEPGMHKRSPEESLAPFHQDPTQRIVVLDSPATVHYLVLRVGALLELLENREGSDIAWDDRKSDVAIAFLKHNRLSQYWVSGCRFFSTTGIHMEVHDFSVRGRTKYLSEQVNEEFGVRYLLPTELRVEIEWELVHSPQSGHDSIVFRRVGVKTAYSLRVKLNVMSVTLQEPEEDPEGDDPNEYFVHVWTF